MNEYPIIAMVGDRGGGKTVTMTALADAFQKSGLKVFANYTLIDIPYEKITFDDIVEFPEYLYDAVILIDEAHIGTDAYAFFSKRVKEITKFSTQTRKRRLIFIYSTQVFTQVAKRLRDLTNNIIYCTETKVKGVIYLEMYDRDPDGEALNKRVLDARPFFDKYDTNEIISLED